MVHRKGLGLLVFMHLDFLGNFVESSFNGGGELLSCMLEWLSGWVVECIYVSVSVSASADQVFQA